MSEELENITEQAAEQNANGREGHVTNEQTDNEQRGYRPRMQRPRIHATRSYSSNYGAERNGYSPRHNSDEEGGFRPEGFGAGLQGSQHQSGGYRPRYNNNGYQQRGYQQRPQSGYRPRYNQNQEGEEGTYQPRPNQGEYGQQRSYPQRSGYNSRYQQGEYSQRGGYRPHYNSQDGEEGGFQPRGGYQQRGGYNNRGGYQQRGGYNNRGGYQQRGGYNNRYQQGEYGQRGGYRQHTADYDPHAKYSMKKRIEYKEEHIDPNEPLRLNKFLANAGICSRREADEYIENGSVKVNGEVVTQLGTKVLRTDVVTFNDQPVSIEKKVYVLLNKPKDCVTTSDDPQQRKTVMDLVKNVCPERIYPVGRLDRNTTGVLLLTNDGDLASKLTHPKFLKKKVYHVFLDKPVAESDLQQVASGIVLEDGEVHADAIDYAHETDKSQVGIEIHSGKNRIVRRIFESLGYRVVKLDRVQFAGLTKKNLRRGDWRFLTEKEVDMLRMGAFE